MATTPVLPPQPTKQPRVSPRFAIALVGALCLGLVVFFIALERRQPPAPTIPALRDARGDAAWFERVTKPTAAASPALQASPRPVTNPPARWLK